MVYDAFRKRTGAKSPVPGIGFRPHPRMRGGTSGPAKACFARSMAMPITPAACAPTRRAAARASCPRAPSAPARACSCAAASAPAAARRFCERLARFGFDPAALQPVYGLAEAALAVTFSPAGRPLRTSHFLGHEIVSVGRPVPGVELEFSCDDPSIVSSDGKSLIAQREGLAEICFRDPLSGVESDAVS